MWVFMIRVETQVMLLERSVLKSLGERLNIESV